MLEGILSRRTETRLNQEIPVRVWGIDADGKAFNEELTTSDISLTGAKLAGLKAKLRQGDIVGMQSPGGKARFRVTWAGDSDSPLAGQISVCCVEPGKCIWDPKFFRSSSEQPPLLEPLGSRRKAVRYICPGGAEVTPKRSGMALWCKLADISYTGCYIETPSPLPVGTQLSAKLTVDGVTIETPAEVRTAHTTVGMGLAFGDMSDEDSQKLGQLIGRLSGTDERMAQSLEKFSAWLDGVSTCQDAMESLRQLVDKGTVEPDPLMSGDIDRLLRSMAELRECVLSRVTNYGPSRISD